MAMAPVTLIPFFGVLLKRRGNYAGTERKRPMADKKAKCRPQRTGTKPGPKTVNVPSHKRSTPKPIKKKC